MGTVNEMVGAADAELVGTAAFPDTARSAIGCQAAGSGHAQHYSKPLLLKISAQKALPSRSWQFSAADTAGN